MAEIVACLTRGKVIVLAPGQAQYELRSAHLAQSSTKKPPTPALFVDVSRGRRNDELCYAVGASGVSCVFTQQLPGTGDERRLFEAEAEIRDLDFSFADEALACTVHSKDGTSAIGLLTDDGKGMRTVTEGDVLDREPRWAPGGCGEIVYASAGVGRTKSGVWVGLSPFALHRLNLADSTVEVLVSDAKFDYLSPVPLAKNLIYALRRAYRAQPKTSALGILAGRLLAPFRKAAPHAPGPTEMLVSGSWIDVADGGVEGSVSGVAGYELVRITEKGVEAVAQRVVAFDANAAGVIAYSDGSGVFRMPAGSPNAAEKIAELAFVEQLVIC